MTDRELLQQTLDAWDTPGGINYYDFVPYIESIRARLAQPEPESMDWMEECADFWNRYTYLNERAQERCEEQAKMWIEKLREKNTNG